MPGPVSDSYDPEWGTSAHGEEIRIALSEVYDRVSAVLGHKPPMDIRVLVCSELDDPISATMSEYEWRMIRFALERAQESI